MSVTLTTTSSTAGFRARAFLRSLRRPRMVTILVFVGALPVVLERVLDFVAPEPGTLIPAVLVGVALVGAIVVLGIVVCALRSGRPRTLVFAAAGVDERAGARTIHHGWASVSSALQDDTALTLYLEPPMKSFRLAPSGSSLILVVPRSAAEAAPLAALVEAYGPGVTRIS
jgi:hypothetical protein